MPVSWRATSWDWQLTSAWALSALMLLQRWVWDRPLSSVRISKRDPFCGRVQTHIAHRVMKLITIPQPSLFLSFFLNSRYLILHCVHFGSMSTFVLTAAPPPPPSSNISLLPAVHFGLSPSLRATQTTPLVHIMWMSRTQALPYCSLRFWPWFLQCEATMFPKDA